MLHEDVSEIEDVLIVAKNNDSALQLVPMSAFAAHSPRRAALFQVSHRPISPQPDRLIGSLNADDAPQRLELSLAGISATVQVRASLQAYAVHSYNVPTPSQPINFSYFNSSILLLSPYC